MTFPPMRPQLELQHAHDMLGQVLADAELREQLFPPEMVRPLIMAADVLCWALHHDTADHPDSNAVRFADILHWIRQDMAELGVKWEPPPDTAYIIEED